MNLQQRTRRLLVNEVSIFIYLWLIYLFFPVLLDLEDAGMQLGDDELVMTAFYMGIVALSNFWLIPRWLMDGKYLRYLVLVLILLVAASVIEESVLEWFLDGGRRREFNLDWDGAGFAFVRLGTILIIFGSFKLFWGYQDKLRRISSLEKEQIESELKFLKSQINPHVLFNNLNSIYYYSMEKPDKMPPIILKLSEIMRYMIYEANEKYVPLNKELDYISNFVELEQIRLEDRGEIRYQVEGEPDGLQIAPLLLISFIENSFKHSSETRNEDIWIDIQITIEGQTLKFEAENNWSESSEDDRPETTGIGLENVQRRLKLLYPNRHSLQIEQTGELYRVFLTIDLSDEQE